MEEPLIAVVDDCRFPNEAEAIQDAGGKVVRLTRNPYKDSHVSECALASYENFDAVIDNGNMSINEVNVEIIQALTKWGWLGAEIKLDQSPDVKAPEPEIVGGIHKFR